MQDGTCRYKKKNMGATVTGFVDIQSGSESLLMEAVATVGPVSVAINALDSFFQYHAGIFSLYKFKFFTWFILLSIYISHICIDDYEWEHMWCSTYKPIFWTWTSNALSLVQWGVVG